MQIDRIDHLVLTVRDIDATCEFYSRVLGMNVITFAGRRKALRFVLESGYRTEVRSLASCF